MKIEVFDNYELAAQRAAKLITSEAQLSIKKRGKFIIAVSGGRTPWIMLRELASENLSWENIHFVQVDERLAPYGHMDRNLTHLHESLRFSPLDPANIHEMKMDSENLYDAAISYSNMLRALAGTPPVLDLIHLGLGIDGHTASLIPGDPVLEITDMDVAPAEVYLGRHRLTLTYPLINRARKILWLVTGDEKSQMLERLIRGDLSIPAGRISREHAIIIADKGAAKDHHVLNGK